MTKKEFVEGPLEEALRSANLDVESLYLSKDECGVLITFSNGHKKTVSIEGDSFGAIILDVTRKALY